MNKFSNTKAIIFDMDGVLLLSSHCHDQAYQETLASIGIKNFSYKNFAGMRTDDAFRRIFDENGLKHDEKMDSLVRAKQVKARELMSTESIVAPGSEELIAQLKKKYRLAIASSASPGGVEIFLEKSGYGDAFEFYLDGSSVLHAKPAPDIYQLAVKKLSLRPEECVVIEDAISGVQAAQKANIPVIAISDDERMNELSPNAIVSNLLDIKDFF